MRGSERSVVVLGCAADSGYAPALAVMVRSILDRLDDDHALRINVLDAGLTGHDRDRLLSSWESRSPEVRFLSPPAEGTAQLPLWGRMTRATYFRLLLPAALPEETKCIWLDCDVLVRQNLADLWNADLGGHSILAVQDMVVPTVSSRFGLADHAARGMARDAPYFNAGVMLVDLERWRRREVAPRAFDYLRERGDRTFFFDQDALNAVLADDWGPLDPRWNQIASVAGRRFYRPRHLDAQTYAGVVEDPWIVHFAGFWKPWTTRAGRWRDEFFGLLDTTAWRGVRPGGTARHRLAAFYEARLRDRLYAVEAPLMHLSRRLTARRVSADDT